MGNSNSMNVNSLSMLDENRMLRYSQIPYENQGRQSTRPQPNIPPSFYDMKHSQNHQNHLNHQVRVLPEIKVEPKLKSTNNGYLLQSVGTISGIKKEEVNSIYSFLVLSSVKLFLCAILVQFASVKKHF
jgi:hypothetical protein